MAKDLPLNLPCRFKPLKLNTMEITINIDGGSRGNPGPGASAFVIKNKEGQVIAKEGKFFDECTNNYAEFIALFMALNKAAQLGATKLDIYSDSQLLVKQYLGEYKIKNPVLQVIMADIKEAASVFKSIKITHVLRQYNKEADALCNITMDEALKKPVKNATAAARVAMAQVKQQQAKQPAIAHTAGVAPKVPVAKKAVAKKVMPEQLELFDKI